MQAGPEHGGSGPSSDDGGAANLGAVVAARVFNAWIDSVRTDTARIHAGHATDLIGARERPVPDLRLRTTNRVLTFETCRAMDRQAINLSHRLDHGRRRRHIFHGMAHR